MNNENINTNNITFTYKIVGQKATGVHSISTILVLEENLLRLTGCRQGRLLK